MSTSTLHEHLGVYQYNTRGLTTEDLQSPVEVQQYGMESL